jgi:putative ABC transport system permease protein
MMLWWSVVLVALREIRRNVLRSFLTILGIVIGVAAVITMVTLGGGATVQVTAEIESLGSNMLIIRPGQRLGPGMRSSSAPFDVDDTEAIQNQIRTVKAVAPVASAATTAIYGNENWSTTVTGITDGFFAVREWPVVSGRTFLDTEYRAGRAACVVGDTVRRELFGGTGVVGETLRLGKLSCEIVGLLEAKGQSARGTDQDNIVLLPLRTFQRRVSGNTDIAIIQVSVHEGLSTEKAKRDIEHLMRERRRISAGEDDDFTVLDMKEIADMLSGTTRVLTMLLGAVAAVSLLVGGIGIMNIMLVSVTERTREIGIRLAIGARERDVLLQFLVEAVVLSSLGGLFGVLLAVGASLSLTDVMKVPFVFDGSIVALAFAFSAAIGVVFGYVPARRAARLDPIEALRHE